MSTLLSLIAIAALLILLFISVRRQLETRAAQRRAEARAYTGAAEAQHERSRRHRAQVRAAHSPARTTSSDSSDDQR